MGNAIKFVPYIDVNQSLVKLIFSSNNLNAVLKAMSVLLDSCDRHLKPRHKKLMILLNKSFCEAKKLNHTKKVD